MRKILAALAMGILFYAVPSLAAEPGTPATAPVAQCALAPGNTASTPAPTADLPTLNGGEIFYWLKAESPILPLTWLLPAGCRTYCIDCGGCCAIGPNWCACC